MEMMRTELAEVRAVTALLTADCREMLVRDEKAEQRRQQRQRPSSLVMRRRRETRQPGSSSSQRLTPSPGRRQISPRGANIMVKVPPKQEKTLGGLVLPDVVQQRPTSGDVVSLGKACETAREGETVLYSKFGIGVTDLHWGEDVYAVLREQDVIGVLPASGATAEDIKEIKPNVGRVLLEVDAADEESLGGVFLTDSAREKPLSATVVTVGAAAEGKEVKVKAGDRVLFFKYAGDTVPTKDGTVYNVIMENDILARI